MIKRIYKGLVPERIRNRIRVAVLRVLAPLYFGEKYTCNCCNRSFNKFYAKGYEKRADAQCPNCGSLERSRLLLFYLQNETSLFKEPLRLLHIAPEACLSKIFSALDIEYIDGDINPDYATHVVDLTQIQYPEEYFDMIICSHVLGHIPNEGLAIREMKRVLKTDGEAIIMTLLNLESTKTVEKSAIQSAKEKLATYGEPDLCRLHGMDMEERLSDQGFHVNVVDYRTHLSEDIVNSHRLGDGRRELIFSCHKEIVSL